MTLDFAELAIDRPCLDGPRTDALPGEPALRQLRLRLADGKWTDAVITYRPYVTDGRAHLPFFLSADRVVALDVRERIADRVVGWGGLTANGEPFEFSRERLLLVLQQSPDTCSRLLNGMGADHRGHPRC